MLLEGGMSKGHRILDEAWIAHMVMPCPIAPFYGQLLWLNRDGLAFRGASTQAYFMLGAGGHYVCVDPAIDAVMVLRWLDPLHAGTAIHKVATALAAG